MKKNLKFKIITQGCRTNIYESEILRSIFLENGLVECFDENEADILILHSCCVTHKAERDARKIISRFFKNERALKILTGCYSKIIKENGFNGKLKLIHNYEDIPPFIGIQNSKIERLHLKHKRFFLKIQEGCDFKCSYCIIPYVRGRSRSRNPDDIFCEFEKSLNLGVKEFVISGTQIGEYGKEFKKDIVWLIENLTKWNFNYRIRLSSIEIVYVNEGLISLLKNPKICKHLHIPLQSGSDKILREMKRPYNTSLFRRKINMIREEIKDLCLGTDIIAGFPGEEDDDFLKTLEFIEEINFSYLHVFSFSKRPFTDLEDKKEIKSDIKKERVKRLILLGDRLRDNFLKNLIGKKLRVLPEKIENGFIKGLSDEYARVYYKGDLMNEFVYLKAKEIFKNGIKGEILCPS
ncbi:MAG: MiaB/RimO family radical SAM methylthiotransferase [candidate division WOR-3 bacterium]